MKKHNTAAMRLMVIVIVSVMLMANSLKADAALRYNNTVSTTTSATVSSDGTVTIYFGYNGIPGVTSRGEITTYIEKRILGIFWTRESIGLPNNQWEDLIYNYKYNSSHCHQFSSTGTYRVTVMYKIYGTGGDPDEITWQGTVTY